MPTFLRSFRTSRRTAGQRASGRMLLMAAVSALAAIPAGLASAAPAMDFERTRHEFGDVWDFQNVSTEFRFVNTGDEALQIKSMKASCGCTTPTLTTMTFAPGEGDVIRVAFDPKGHGKQAKTVNIITNVPGRERIVLTIASNVLPFIKVQPTILSFQNLEDGKATTKRVTFKCVDPAFEIESLQITGAASRFSDVRTVSIERSEEIGTIGVLDVTVRADAPRGRFFGSLFVSGFGKSPVDDVPVRRTHTVNMSGSVWGELIASDYMYRVGVVKPAGSFDRSVTIKSRDGKPFTILSTDLTTSSMPMQITVHPIGTTQSEYRLQVTGEAGDYLGAIRGRLTVHTSIAAEPQMAFDVMGMVRDLNAREKVRSGG